MSLNIEPRRNRKEGFALMSVTVLTGISLLAIASVLRWSSNHALWNERSNDLQQTLAAAEAAQAKVVAQISKDYQLFGEAQVFGGINSYARMVPTVADSPLWSNYQFTDAQQSLGRLSVERTTSWGYTSLETKFKGLKAYCATYRVISNARKLGSPYGTAAAISQNIQLASIPVFGFGIFYNLDLEICPSATLGLTGRVHSNGNLYLEPDNGLTLGGDVTSARQILQNSHPDDPIQRTKGPITYRGGHDGGVNTLTLPLGTNANPAVARTIIEIPPLTELVSSLVGQQRFYNRVDMIILVTDSAVVAKSGSYNGFLVTIPWSTVRTFLSTNVSFFDKRENKDIQATEIDVQKLNTAHTALSSLLGRSLKSIYVADSRTQSVNTQPGIRLINGQTLPPYGLTLATPNPAYVQGHYNAYSGHLGTTNTTRTLPAAIIADALTILSGGWKDNNSGDNLQSRVANNTTVNAAFLAGIVLTGGGFYSGGVENLPRLLEDWSGSRLTINGSFVVFFPSRVATAPWGATADVYAPPSRRYNFDLNFLDASKLPAATPELRTVLRSQWANIAPNTVK